MGTILTKNKIGTPCTSCWGVGKPFGHGPTPHIIQVRLTSLLPGEFSTPAIEQDLLTTHWLERIIDFCTWEITQAGFLWRLVYSLQFTNLLVERISDAKRAFVDNFPPTCELDLPNALVNPAGNIAYNGFANLTWDPEALL